MLPYGVYTFHQVSGWDGRDLLPDFDVYIAKDGQTYHYASITELYEAILNRLIDKIVISAVEVVDGEKVQKVRIAYNFVGEIER